MTTGSIASVNCHMVEVVEHVQGIECRFPAEEFSRYRFQFDFSILKKETCKKKFVLAALETEMVIVHMRAFYLQM